MLESYYGAQAYSWYFPFDNFASLNLTVSSPVQTFVEPLTITDACDFLRIPVPTAGTSEYRRLRAMIPAARNQAEIMQGRELVQKQWDLALDYWLPGYRIRLLPQTSSVQLVQYTDSDGNETALTAGTDYALDTAKQPAFIYPPCNKVWPTFTPQPSSSVLIRFTAGYANNDPYWLDMGTTVKMGMLQLISWWWNNGMAFELGSGAGEWGYTITSCLSYGALVRVR